MRRLAHTVMLIAVAELPADALRGEDDVHPRVTYVTAIDQQSDTVAGVAADAAGNLWLVGSTNNADFPITGDAADPTHSAFDDGYVVRLDAAGRVTYATYLGGSGINCIGDVAVDDDGNVYIAGTTTSVDLPLAGQPAQATAPGGAGDGFIAKLDASGRLLAATYFGGAGYESCPGRGYPVASIALGPAGAVYVLIGSSNSTAFPASGATRTRIDADGLLARLDRDLQPAWGRFIGGTGLDQMTRVASDAEGNAYVTGSVSHEFGGAHDFATTPGALQTSTETETAPVLAKYTPTGDLAYATFLTATRGSSGSRWYPNLAVAGDGTAYVAVVVSSTDLPATSGAWQTMPRGATDLFVFAVQPDGSALRYGSYFGGSLAEEANLTLPGIAVDEAGRVALGFATFSNDVPLRHAFETTPTSNAIASLAADGGNLLYASYLRHSAHSLAHRGAALFVGGRSFPPNNGIGAVRIAEDVASCAGDCDGDTTVRVNELVTGVRIALGEIGSDACAVFDRDGDGAVSIAELIAAVGNLLTGCA